MSDTPPTTPEPKPPEKKKNQTPRSIVNKKHVNTLDKTGLVLTAAQKTDYATLLAGSDIDDAFVSQLDDDATACAERIANAMNLTTGIRTATKAELKARRVLHAANNEIRAAAKQKYARNGSPETLKDYNVGVNITSSRAMLLQSTDGMLTKLKTDTLPGVKAADITALKNKRKAYAAANAAQVDVQSQATSERNGIEDDVKSILDRRAQLQFAADHIWPADDKANAPIRREFHLPPYRPLSR